MSTLEPAPPDRETELPLVLGVTGHRDLVPEDRDGLREQVRSLFREVRACFPHTPLLLLSALADGADRLVAEVAAEEAFQVPVVGVLPLRRELYEADFAGGARKEFTAWLDHRARCWFELPLADGNTEAGVAVPGPARDRQYAQAGEYVARHSQVLLALWDGEPAKREDEAGTAHVFAYKKDGHPLLPGSKRRGRLEAVEAALLCHLVTPRQGRPRPADALRMKTYFHEFDEEQGVEVTRDGAGAVAGFRRVFAPAEQFNRTDRLLAPALGPERRRSLAGLLPGSQADWPASLRALRPLAQRYTLADALALHYQRSTLNTLWALYGLVGVAVLLFEFHAHGLSESVVLLACFVALLAAAYLWHRRSRGRDYQNKYQDYRALAEGLRIQLFWRLAGLGELDAPVADHYLLEHASELDWIRNALRTWNSGWSCAGAAGRLAPQDRPPPELGLVVEHWVHSQEGFFRRAARRLHLREKGLHFWSKGVVIALSVLLVLGVIVTSLSGLHDWLLEHQPGLAGPLLRLPLLVVSALLVASALTHDYISKLALAEQVKAYRRMRALFGKAEEILRECLARQDVPQAQAVLKRLVEEALAENGDWVLLHRGRPVEVPHW
jgi:hypothetical protein